MARIRTHTVVGLGALGVLTVAGACTGLVTATSSPAPAALVAAPTPTSTVTVTVTAAPQPAETITVTATRTLTRTVTRVATSTVTRTVTPAAPATDGRDDEDALGLIGDASDDAPAGGAVEPDETSDLEGPFRNCAQARAAGAASLHVGDSGYAARLDGDGVGVACE